MSAGRMSAEVADAIREEAARAALAQVKASMERHGETPEVLALAVEGLAAGAALHAWRNRAEGTPPGRFRKLLAAIMDKAVSAAIRREK